MVSTRNAAAPATVNGEISIATGFDAGKAEIEGATPLCKPGDLPAQMLRPADGVFSATARERLLALVRLRPSDF